MNDDELRGALRAAVPEPPDGSGWAGTARERAGRAARTRRTVGLGVVAALVATGLLLPSWSGQGGRAVPASQPASASASSLPGNADCTTSLTGSTTLQPRQGVQVTRVSLCPRSGGPTFTTPASQVTDGATALFDTVAGLPTETVGDPDCSADTERRYLVVFTLADDSTRVLEAATPNACGATTSEQNRRRWTGMLEAVQNAWTAPRRDQSSADTPAPCLPFDRPGLFPAKPAEVLAGVACRFGSQSTTPLASVPVPKDQLAVLTADLTANSSRGDNIDSPRNGDVLTLAAPFGDPLVLWSVGGGQWFAFMPQGRQLFWQPGAEARRILDLLFGRPGATSPGVVVAGQGAVTPTPSPSLTPSPPEACQGLTPSSAPTQAPTTADRLRLCPTGWYTNVSFAPLDTVDGERATAVLQVLAAQPQLTGQLACTAEQGPDFLLVAETDGQAPVVMVLQLYGCRLAGILNAPHGGANLVVDSFKAQLSAQRAAAPSTWQRPGALCGSLVEKLVSEMPVDPKDVMGGRLCVYPARSEVPSRELILNEALAKGIAGEVIRHSATLVPRGCSNETPHRRLALTNAYGDVLVLTEFCDKWQYGDGMGPRQWTPSSAIAKQLKELAQG